MNNYTNMRAEACVTSAGRILFFDVKGQRGADDVLLATVNFQPDSATFPHTETEAKCWADLFADALRMKRENEDLRAELAKLRSETMPDGTALVTFGGTDTSLPAETLGGAVGRLSTAEAVEKLTT